MTDYKQPVSKPCNDCPFRRASMPGWLATRQEAVDQVTVDSVNRKR